MFKLLSIEINYFNRPSVLKLKPQGSLWPKDSGRVKHDSNKVFCFIKTCHWILIHQDFLNLLHLTAPYMGKNNSKDSFIKSGWFKNKFTDILTYKCHGNNSYYLFGWICLFMLHCSSFIQVLNEKQTKKVYYNCSRAPKLQLVDPWRSWILSLREPLLYMMLKKYFSDTHFDFNGNRLSNKKNNFNMV